MILLISLGCLGRRICCQDVEARYSKPRIGFNFLSEVIFIQKKIIRSEIWRIAVFGCILLLLISCSTRKEENSSLAQADSVIVEQAVNVRTDVATRKTFLAQVITNGKVLTTQEIPLSFQGQGIIGAILVKNGAVVQSGALLASLKNEQQQLALREASLLLQESRVEVSDQLITQGGKRGDTTSVSSEVYTIIKLRSGFNRALLEVKKAELELSKTYLYAPVPGTVANLTVSAHSPVSPSVLFCTLLNRNELYVRCPILETELSAVKGGQTAKVFPVGFSEVSYNASVANINPVVNAQGLVDVTLRVASPDSRLLSGMNVRVVIEKKFPGKIVIPKMAVVERTGRKVVFMYSDGLAKWQYVTTGQENDEEITVVEGVKEGDEIITSGNLNLGHDAKVTKAN